MFFFWRKSSNPFQSVILVTGCSSGIGLALAKILYTQLHYRVVVTGRGASLPHLIERFPETERFWVRFLDVTVDSERQQLIAEINAKWGGVNILVNNAGVSYRAVVEHMSAREEHHQFETNYFGPVSLIRAVLPTMRQAGWGKIINVSSVSGMLAMPTMGSYSASKYALEGISEALWFEVRPLGINVSLIQPGFVRSKSFLNVQYSQLSGPEHGTEGLYADYYENMTPFIERLMGYSLTTPASVARQILKTMEKRNPALWVPATLDAKTFYYLRRFIPRRILLEVLFATLPRVKQWAKTYTQRSSKK